MPLRRVYFYLAVAVAVVALGIGLRFHVERSSGDLPGTTVVDKGSRPDEKAVAPAIGGPFSLVNHEGEPVSDATYRGRYMLVFFGYTYCPDVCPTTMTTISAALDLMGGKAERLQPLFITVDPGRDTPEQLAEYLRYFHPGITGLTGTAQQVAAAEKTFGVYSAKVSSPDGTDDPNDYLMDHSSPVYLMGPDGQFLRTFSYGTTAEAMALDIQDMLAARS